jgi:hypothetical protein
MHMTERIYDSDCPFDIFKLFSRICWIVPKKYLLLLHQTILLHFRSVFCISWNFARDISTVFEEIKHLRSRAPENILPDY